ncbi:MAG: DNA translocase FtsK [Deinococcales bacterium]
MARTTRNTSSKVSQEMSVSAKPKGAHKKRSSKSTAKVKTVGMANQNRFDLEAVGLLLLVIGLVAAAIFLPLPYLSERLTFREVITGRIGWASFLLPWPFIFIGALFLFRREPKGWGRLIIAYSFLSLSLWLLSALLSSAKSLAVGSWGLYLKSFLQTYLNFFAYLMPLALLSFALDVSQKNPLAYSATQSFRWLRLKILALIQFLLKKRRRMKRWTHFKADVALVEAELKRIDRDVVALGTIHHSPEEAQNLKRWRDGVKDLEKGLQHTSPEDPEDVQMLKEAQEVSNSWREALTGLCAETREMFKDVLVQEKIGDYDQMLAFLHDCLEKPFGDRHGMGVGLEHQRHTLKKSLCHNQRHYQSLLKQRDSTLKLLERPQLSAKQLESIFKAHHKRLENYKNQAENFNKLLKESQDLQAWHDLSEYIELYQDLSHPNIKEYFANFGNALSSQGAEALKHDRLRYWHESFLELEARLARGERELESQPLPFGELNPLTHLTGKDNEAKPEKPWQEALKPLSMAEVDPETTLEELPKNFTEATLGKINSEQQPSIALAKPLFTETVAEVVKNPSSKHEQQKLKFKDEVVLELPRLDLLESSPLSSFNVNDRRVIEDRATIINRTIANFRLTGKVQIETSQRGPTVTRFEVRPGEGEKISRYASLSDDIALAMGVASVRIEAPIQGKKDIIGLEVPNEKRDMVRFRESLESQDFKKMRSDKGKLPVVLGKSIENDFWIRDLGKMPHLLIAGSTGSGKSVAVNTLISSLLYQFLPTDLRFLMVDPKMVELTPYDGLPHLLRPVVTNPNDAAGVLLGAVAHMERRYKMMSKIGAKSLEQYNRKALELDMPEMPYIVIIIDELADLMITSPKEVESAIMRLAQMARATGMHLILATQRPSVDILTSLIKVNVPARMAFAVSSSHDSRTILDTVGAERLTGQGDMLFYQPGLVKPIRLQGPFISESEIQELAEFLRQQTPFFNDDFVEAYGSDFDPVLEDESQASGLVDWNDDKLREAAEMVINEGQASVSRLQRRLQVGHARAGKLMDSLEALAIVGRIRAANPVKSWSV